MSEQDDEYREPDPRKPVEVARRAMILSAVVCRSYLEYSTDEEYRQETVGYIYEWLDENDLWRHAEQDEKEILRAPLGKVPRSLSVRGTWYAEGLAILAWALRRSDFPPHDTKIGPVKLTDALDFLDPDTSLLVRPRRRSRKAIRAAREWFYIAHCALRGFLNHGGDGHLPSGIGQYLKALRLDPRTVMADGGLAFEGKPLAEADRERLEEWESVICERHRAAIWLVGEDELYTEISVDT